MNKIYLFLLIFVISISCNENKPKNIEFKIGHNNVKTSEFNISRLQITRKILKPENISGIFTDIIVKDSLLICGNLYDPKLLNIYSVESKKLLNQIIKRGTSSNEGLSASNFYFQNDTNETTLWVYDITLGKLFKTSFLNDIKDSAFVAKKEILLKGTLKNMVSPQIINDSLILATSYSLDDCRYFYSDGKNILRKVGKLPNVINSKKLTNIPNAKIPNKAYIFKALAVKNPIQNKIAVFYNKTDRAEFFANDRLIKILNSTNDFNPEIRVKKINDGYVVQDSDKTKYSYLSIAFDKDCIYALYAGNKDSTTSSNTILVFDWLGNVIKKISLDRKICKITLEPNRKILFCYDELSEGIFSTQL